MVSFIFNRKPLSHNSVDGNKRERYKQYLIQQFGNDFANLYPDIPLQNKLYSKIIYIYRNARHNHDVADVDNISKPIVDAFRGVIYTDDNIINHRVCSKIELTEYQAQNFRIDTLPPDVAEKLVNMLTGQEEHIVYFEVDDFDYNMISFGGYTDEA